jgi:hypothetical protein
LAQTATAQNTAAPAPKAAPRAPNVPVPLKIQRYSQRLVEKYDSSGDGKLDQSEWSQMQGNPRLADRDRDGVVTPAELANHIARYARRRRIRLMPTLSGGRNAVPSLLNPTVSPNSFRAAQRPKPASDTEDPSEKAPTPPVSKAARGGRRSTKFAAPRSQLPRGLPPWFRLRDTDGDAQLTMAEFAPKPTQSQLDEFARYDRNGDGLVTAEEGALGPGLLPPAVAPQKEPLKEAAAEEVSDETTQETAEAAAEEAAALKSARKNRSKKLLKPSSKKSGAESG